MPNWPYPVKRFSKDAPSKKMEHAGAVVGRDCCLFYGAVLEFDLLSIGDFAKARVMEA